jgi:hypothetical protein
MIKENAFPKNLNQYISDLQKEEEFKNNVNNYVLDIKKSLEEEKPTDLVRKTY